VIYHCNLAIPIKHCSSKRYLAFYIKILITFMYIQYSLFPNTVTEDKSEQKNYLRPKSAPKAWCVCVWYTTQCAILLVPDITNHPNRNTNKRKDPIINLYVLTQAALLNMLLKTFSHIYNIQPHKKSTCKVPMIPVQHHTAVIWI